MWFQRCVFFVVLLVVSVVFGKSATINGRYVDVIVAKDSTGDFATLSEAIASLPMYNYERTIIFIKDGVYNEKIRLECDYVTLIGESRDSTIIEYSQLRTDWLSNPDYIGPAVINIHADDIILKNLTIRNTQPALGSHAFTIYGTGTRTIILNCNVISKGGDTVSLWNYKNGMYYHSNCHFEGAVDFVCPRGWCYINNSTFYENSKVASIWHAAVLDSNQKFVIKNSKFDGVKNFILGRHHYEAQFFLLNCTFSSKMADREIFRVIYNENPEKNRPFFYGDRYFYYNCRRQGKNFGWYKNNVEIWPSKLKPEIITPIWTFDYKWDPENELGLTVVGKRLKDKDLIVVFSELVGVRGELKVTTKSGKTLNYKMGSGRDRIMLTSKDKLPISDLAEPFIITSGEIYGIKASIEEQTIKKTFSIP